VEFQGTFEHNPTFVGNMAFQDGGAIYCQGVTNCAIGRGSFHQNRSVNGDGGAMAMEGGSLDIDRAQFIENFAATNGGALYGTQMDQVLMYPVTGPGYSPTNGWPVLFEGNNAKIGGAGFFDRCERVDVYRAAFLDNDASSVGAIYTFASPHIKFYSSLFAGNQFSSGYSANVAFIQCTGEVSQCTIVSNQPIGLSWEDSELMVINSILWKNGIQATNYSGITGTYTYYCCIQNGGIKDINGITNTPLLYANYHLRSDSPCIGHGSSSSSEYDIDREDRGEGGQDDIGCDEFHDTDGDTWPDVVETGTGSWVHEWNTGTSPTNRDSDADGAWDASEPDADTDPNDPNSVLKFTRVLSDATTFTYFWKGGTQAVQVLEFTTNLTSTNNWTPFYTNLPPTGVSNALGMIKQNNKLILRLKAHR